MLAGLLTSKEKPCCVVYLAHINPLA